MSSSGILPAPGQPVTGPDPSFHSASQARVTTFATDSVTPPSRVYVTPDNSIVVRMWNSLAGVTVRFGMRLLLVDGTITTFQADITPTANRNAFDTRFPLYEGWLLDLSFGVPAGIPLRGQLFCIVALNRGGNVAGFNIETLVADYITLGQGNGWPNGPVNEPTEGPGFVHTVAITQPAAGAEWTVTVPTNLRWRPLAAAAVLTTAAAVANRVPDVQLDDGANVYFVGVPNQSIPAATPARVSYAQQIPAAAANVTDVMVQLAEAAVLMAGHRISSLTRNIQAADQYSAIFLSVEEWLEPAS